jgi:hypothetical protein
VSKGSEAIAAMLKDAKARQAAIADTVRAAERTLVKRRAKLAEVDAEVRSLEADLAALTRHGNLRVVG